MALQWSTHGALAVAAALVAVAMAWFVYSTRPDRIQNRLLGAAIALGGLSTGFYFGAPLFATERALARDAIGIGVTLLVLLPPVYLLFLGTIRTPLTRPFRGRAAFWSLALYTVLVEAAWLAAPGRFADGLTYHPQIGGWHLDPGAPHRGLRILLLGGLGLVQLYGLLVALAAFRNATTRTARDQAASFALAFGSRDLLGAAFILYFGARAIRMNSLEESVFILALPVMDLLFYLLLAYGILRTQLFDIDLRLKAAFERTLIVAPFAATFFVVTEALERLVPFESFWLGVGSAGAIGFLLRPIRRGASRIADGIIPGVAGTPDYLLARSREVYRHAVEAALEDGAISASERRVLERLEADLGLAGGEAARLEAAAGAAAYSAASDAYPG